VSITEENKFLYQDFSRFEQWMILISSFSFDQRRGVLLQSCRAFFAAKIDGRMPQSPTRLPLTQHTATRVPPRSPGRLLGGYDEYCRVSSDR